MTGNPLLNRTAKGEFVIAATPLIENGALDTGSIASMVDIYIQRGVAGLTILGIWVKRQSQPSKRRVL